MDISLSDRSIVLILGGLAFMFLPFADVDIYKNGKTSIKIHKGNKKYIMFIIGISLIIAGLFLPLSDSGQQNDAPVVNNTNILTQTIISEQGRDTPATLATKKKSNMDRSLQF